MAKLKGYKTIIVAGLLALYAVLGFAGVDVPSPDGEEAMAVSALLMIVLRLVTTSPPGGGA